MTTLHYFINWISLHDLFLNLFNYLIDPDLNFFLLLLLCIQLLSFTLLLIANIQFAFRPPRIPLINEPLAICDELRTIKAVIRSVFFVERTTIFPKIFPD